MTAAAKKAQAELKRAHPEINDEDLKVDLPPQPVAGPSNAPGGAHAAVFHRAHYPPPDPLRVGGIRGLGHALLDMGAALAPRPLLADIPPFGGLRGVADPRDAVELNNALRVLEREQEMEAMRQRIRRQDAFYHERRARQIARPPAPAPPPAPAVNVYVNGVRVAEQPQPVLPRRPLDAQDLFADLPAIPLPRPPVAVARAGGAVRRTRARR